MRPVLGLETSGRLTGAAIAIGDRLLGEAAIDIAAGREELLLALADDLMRRHGIGVRDLARIGVSLGPGSFTGIRVGVAAAQALAFGGGLELVGVPSHQAMAYAFAGLDLTIILLTGIRKGQVFVETGLWAEGRWCPSLPGQSVPLEVLESHLSPILGRPDERSSRFLFLGEAVESVRERVPEIFGRGDRIGAGLGIARRPGPIALLAARPDAVSTPAGEAEFLQPLYLRAADARKPGTR